MASIILPNQLFPEPVDEDIKYLVEHSRYFTDFNFHRKKLILHRASMKAYSEKFNVEYFEYDQDIAEIFQKEDKIRIYNPVDHKARNQLEGLAEKFDVELVFEENPGFMASMDFNQKYFSSHKYFQLNYYKQMRKKFNILVDDEGKPEGGKWSFDPENRKKMPEDIEKPEIPQFSSQHVEDAKEYVEENFPENPGKIEDFFWPATREQALKNLEDFLENRLEKFGDYQDAIDPDLKFGFHSLLSSSINLGLLTPEEIVEKTLQAHEEKDYPMNSLEGFLRQIIGWREFIRAMYELEPGMREANFWNADNSMPEEFYSASTGLPPVDDSIRHALDDAYAHHIERLMVLGNVMLLLEIDPDEVYDWFMEMFIDSYDWVMVPNIYGMSQYAYENMMTKPYISSSNYINKMSHYEGGDWEDHWDGLYWNFINKHREKISDIHRMSFMTSTLDRMNDETVENHLKNAKEFKKKLGLK
ncbi:cryptochrome/photolyase family protein [Candidatus Nanohalovita haloferacivicina]|uniref:cryptochrome/photolyase family protein n=1 Tax=Candidatus Nanohalovita haloferacivicina TaxID=2978046 RepID=UPI00325FC882|nr:Deoxyribodipyrimidine photolyase-related protein [Candidatus Nanohalobia archaeon BNXNv]